MPFLLPILLTVAAQTQPTPDLEPIQIVMDDVTFVGQNIKNRREDFMGPLQEMFRKAGFTVLPSKGAVPPNALQIRFTVGAVHDTYGRLAYQVFGRLSEGRDANLKENSPGQPQRVWFGEIKAARSVYEDGISEIHATLANIATLLYKNSSQARGHGPTNVSFEVLPLPQSARINPTEVHNIPNLKVSTYGFRHPLPEIAVARRIGGTVAVEVIVGENGKPLRAHIKQGPAELNLHALQWAMGYEFEPAMAEGKTVKARVVIDLNYLQYTMERYSIR